MGVECRRGRDYVCMYGSLKDESVNLNRCFRKRNLAALKEGRNGIDVFFFYIKNNCCDGGMNDDGGELVWSA